MKIRVYSPYFPYPVSEGAHQVIFDQVRFLGLYHDVEIVTWKSRGELVTLFPFSKNVKWIDWSKKSKEYEIEVQHEGLFGRFFRVFKSVVSKDASPELFYYSPSSDQRRGLGSCDLAIYHYSFSHSWLKRLRMTTEKKVVVYFHNLESNVFLDRAKAELNPLKKIVHLMNAKKLQKNEDALAVIADEIWQISDVDLKDYASRKHTKPPMQSLRPPTFDPDFFSGKVRHTNDKPVLGFLGGLDFQPNLESLDWILTHLAPILREQNFAGKIVSVGKNAPEWILKKGSEFPFYEHLGFVSDLENFWSHLSAMLIPHVTGSGVRVKLLESLARGIPVMCNKAALERIHPELQKSLLLFVSEDPKEWSKKTLALSAAEKITTPKALTGDYIYKDFTF
jgi:glycosyltransferase involved in cell wall biosynthesis